MHTLQALEWETPASAGGARETLFWLKTKYQYQREHLCWELVSFCLLIACCDVLCVWTASCSPCISFTHLGELCQSPPPGSVGFGRLTATFSPTHLVESQGSSLHAWLPAYSLSFFFVAAIRCPAKERKSILWFQFQSVVRDCSFISQPPRHK